MPIGGEFASSYSNDYFLKEHLDMTLLLLKQSHQTFIGPKIIIDEGNGEKYEQPMNEILKVLGHRLYVDNATIERQKSGELNVSLNLRNDGTAPIYTDTQLEIYIYDNNGNMISKAVATNFNPGTILPDNGAQNVNVQIDTSNLENNTTYNLCVALEDRNTNNPIIELAMQKYKDKVYKIGQFNW